MGLTSVDEGPLLFGELPKLHSLCAVACVTTGGDLIVTSGGKCMCLTVDLNLSFVAEVWLSGSNGLTGTKHDL